MPESGESNAEGRGSRASPEHPSVREMRKRGDRSVHLFTRAGGVRENRKKGVLQVCKCSMGQNGTHGKWQIRGVERRGSNVECQEAAGGRCLTQKRGAPSVQV